MGNSYTLMALGVGRGGMRLVSGSGLAWTDIEGPVREEIAKLGKEYPFHPLNLDDCVSKRQLPKVDEYEDHLFVLLQFPVYEEKSNLVRESQVCMFLGKDYVVTIHEKELQSLGNIFKSCQEDETRRSAYMKSTTALFYNVINTLVDDLFPVLKRVTSDLEEIEDRVFNPRQSVAVELSRQRRVIADLRRMVAPLRRLFLDMTVDVQKYGSEDYSKYFSDVREHIEKTWAVLEESKETIEIYKDTDYVLSTESTNKVLAVLTIIFTLTIPATVVGAIYGMNVPLPGGTMSGPLTFFGPFTSFILLLLLAFVPAIIMVLYFRNKTWL